MLPDQDHIFQTSRMFLQFVQVDGIFDIRAAFAEIDG